MNDYFDSGKKVKIIFAAAIFIFILLINFGFNLSDVKGAIAPSPIPSPTLPAKSANPSANVSCDASNYGYPWCKSNGELGGSGGLINTIYNYSLALVGVAALGAIIYGGIMYTVSAGNPSKQSDAVAWITGAIWGIVLLLGASLLLRTINPQIVNLEFPKIEPITVAAPVSDVQVSIPQSLATGTFTNQEALTELTKYGIKVTSSTGCIGQDAKGCTDLEGMPQSVPLKLLQLKTNSNADIVITGGTETVGHDTHGPGKSIVDLKFNSNLDNYIYGEAVETKDTEYGTVYKTSDGTKFLKESDHWHVVFL